ncbi:hypothetical protein GCM10022245_54820 [Streptomyces mayteni]
MRVLTASSTRSRFSGLTRAAPESTRETVGTDTPAIRATSAMVAGRLEPVVTRPPHPHAAPAAGHDRVTVPGHASESAISTSLESAITPLLR